MTDLIMKEMQQAAVAIGKAEWGATKPMSMTSHKQHVGNSVKIIAENFDQTGPQAMHGLYLEGSETVLGHTGTSPNSGTHARILTALWNRFVNESEIALKSPLTNPLHPAQN
jgi:hypothetical protein